MKRLTVAVFGLMVASVAVGAEWVEVQRDNTKRTFIETTKIKILKTDVNNRLISGWVRNEFFDNKNDIESLNRQYLIECNKDLYKLNTYIAYDKSGHLLQNITDMASLKENGSYRPIVPGSEGELWFSELCKRSK